MRAVVYLRFPRNRDGFKDPPVVEWNSAKERELWALLKSTSTDLEWRRLAEHFGVPVVYILQQAAWLYEKELGSLRRRMTQISQANRPKDSKPLGINSTLPSTSSPRRDQPSNLPDYSDDLLAHDISGPLPAMGRANRSGDFANDTIINNTDAQTRAARSADDFFNNSNNNNNNNNGSSTSDSGDGLSDSGDFQPFRRLLSTSRIRTGSVSAQPSDESEEEFSDLSLDGFVIPPQLQNQRPRSERAASPSSDSPSDSDSTVSQSALEEALMERQSVSDSDI